MEEIFYTVKELAEKIKVHPKTVLAYIRSGEMKAFKVGKDWRIPKDIFQKWIQDQLAKEEKNESK